MTKTIFFRQRLADLLGPLYKTSQGQCSTQIKHSYWFKELKISLKGFTLGVKAEIEKKKKIFSIFHPPSRLLIN
jgi:hypothetical protein